MPDTELCAPLVLRLYCLKPDSDSASEGSWFGVCILIHRPRQKPKPASLQNRFSPQGHLVPSPCNTSKQTMCSPRQLQDWQRGREINGFPVQQRPSCKAAEFNMQTPPPRPQTPSSWLSGQRQLEPHNVCALRLLGPSYYSLGFSIIR